jgi:asparagine synthase (glutamine-hydrolysing)
VTSLAEFLMTSRLTFPHTYYRNIQGVEPRCIYTFAVQNGSVTRKCRQYFHLDFNVDSQATECTLAEELGAAFKSAVKRRTLPMLGRVGVGLSGGLDSRALLSATGQGAHIRAFTLFDEENSEFKTAGAIARACGVELVPIKRDFEFYGNTAELGVRISGGTGCITCNHYLGARERLKDLGLRTFLTGCYCDYLFKGLAFNRRERWLSRTETLNDFQFEFYDRYHWLPTPSRDAVLARLRLTFPEAAKAQLSESDWLEVEQKRIFPLAYEQDLAQRTIPQRVLPWYVPIVDNDILAIYLKTPPRFKLNGSLFRKMLCLSCPPDLLRIPDNNTGARVNASWPNQALHHYWMSLRNRMADRANQGMATPGSWPNWRHYLLHSQTVESLWNRPNPQASSVFTEILGSDPFRRSIGEHLKNDLVLFMRLLTQKLWFDQRI